MPEPVGSIEQALLADLEKIGDRLIDEDFAIELYRALTNTKWSRADGSWEDCVAVSWRRAEEIVNDLRVQIPRPALSLAQTGGEGRVARRVDQELGRLGWRHQSLDTGRHEDHHVDSLHDPPPKSRSPLEELRTLGIDPSVPPPRQHPRGGEDRPSA